MHLCLDLRLWWENLRCRHALIVIFQLDCKLGVLMEELCLSVEFVGKSMLFCLELASLVCFELKRVGVCTSRMQGVR